MRRRVIALAFGLVVSAALFAGLAWAAGGAAQADFSRACQATLSRLEIVVHDAATPRVRTVAMQLHVPRAGVVIGAIAFNPTGYEVAVARDAAEGRSGFAVGCSGGSTSLRAGRSYEVATLRKHLAPGRYTLRFKLNATGRRILARLGARDRAYRTHHPHGRRAPTIDIGVGLGFTPTTPTTSPTPNG